MRNRLLRSVLGAAFSALVALGVLSGVSGGKGDVRAVTEWPSVAAHTDATAAGAGS
ncbi:hypothetical protein QQY24_14685 [Streptomyces sp. TG1A-8]|uniref:hypothetical protein n=1 Tax=Streptomyces sp. TG1A-8 TaxID=3051385 RepID=UPI00265BB8DF|nr:hypothetical protein [Streptomyces sp. TG1A-8]MDO0926597.1 hypothetical protein [Streptomyces sp. TG1A-8]